mgnify:FL=1
MKKKLTGVCSDCGRILTEKQVATGIHYCSNKKSNPMNPNRELIDENGKTESESMSEKLSKCCNAPVEVLEGYESKLLCSKCHHHCVLASELVETKLLTDEELSLFRLLLSGL